MSTPNTTESPLGHDVFGARSVMNYVECSLATDLTLPQWRRARAEMTSHRRHGLRRRRPGHGHPTRC
jgi:hypothetical protein